MNLSEIERYPWPKVDGLVTIGGLRQKGERLCKGTDYGIILNLPTGIVHQTQFLRGYDDWLMDTIALKREFGDNLCFWGAIDTQHVLIGIHLSRGEINFYFYEKT